MLCEQEVKEQDPGMASRIQKELGIRIGLSDWEKYDPLPIHVSRVT